MAALGKSGKVVSRRLAIRLRVHRRAEPVTLTMLLENPCVVRQAISLRCAHPPESEHATLTHLGTHKGRVTELERHRGRRLARRGGFLQDHPEFSVASSISRRGDGSCRLLPKCPRMAMSWISLASCSRPLDSRFPHDQVDSNRLVPDPDSHLRHRERLSQGRFTQHNESYIQLNTDSLDS
jgi:hypothetical protein